MACYIVFIVKAFICLTKAKLSLTCFSLLLFLLQ